MLHPPCTVASGHSVLANCPGVTPRFLALFVLLVATPGAVLAAPPYITDDTGTQGRGNWQLELTGENVHHDKTAVVSGVSVNQERKVTLAGPVLTYGVTDNVDVAIGAFYLRDQIVENGKTVHDARGTTDSTVEVKWRFYERDGLSLAIKPGLLLPTGNEDKGLGTGALSWGVNGILTYEAARWTWLANVAYSEVHFKNSDDEETNHRHLWRVSGGLGYLIFDKLKLAAEAGVRTNPAKDDPFLPGQNGNFVTLGFIYSPDPKVDIGLGYRKSTNKGESDWAIPFGLTIRW